eukprot:12400783-Karenia_brevis.AAC.1
MFYKRYIALRALRYSAGCPSPDRTHKSLLDDYATSWYQMHRPFKQFDSDGAMGLNNQWSID